MLKDTIKITGTPTFTLYDENGDVKHSFTLPNLVVTAGKNFIASRMGGTAMAVMSHIGIGSSGIATAAGQTNLQTPIVRGSMTVAGGTILNNTITYSASYVPGVGTGSIAEAGVFNAASAGTMLSRITFGAFTKSALDTLVIDWIFEII